MSTPTNTPSPVSARLGEPVDVPTGERRVRDAGDTAVEVTSHILLIVWSVIVIVPFLWVLLSSFKTTREILGSPFSLPARWQFDNYAHAWTDAGIGRFFLNTVIVVGVLLLWLCFLKSRA